MNHQQVLSDRRPIAVKSSFPIRKSTGLQTLRTRLVACGLPENIVDDWLQRHLVLNLQKNDIVFTQATPADVIYFVRTGLVEISSHDQTGRSFIIEIATPGDLLGFTNFSDAGPVARHLFDARARTRCELGIIARERIEETLEQLSPAGLVAVCQCVNDWWSEKIQHWVTFTAMSARERLQSVLTRLAEKCGVEDHRGTVITAQLSHDDFALMIGNSRPMVSRLLAEMLAEGWLSRRHNRYVLNRTPGPVQSDALMGRRPQLTDHIRPRYTELMAK